MTHESLSGGRSETDPVARARRTSGGLAALLAASLLVLPVLPVLLVLLVAGAGTSAHALTIDASWVGEVGSWSAPSEWSSDPVVPNNDATDQFNVTIGTEGDPTVLSVSVDVPVTVSGLELASGWLNLQEDLVVEQDFVWKGGLIRRLTGAPSETRLTTRGVGLVEGAGPFNLGQETVVRNEGVLRIVDSDIRGYRSVIENAPGAVLEYGGSITRSDISTVIRSEGLLRKVGDSVVDLSLGELHALGPIEVTGGELVVGGGYSGAFGGKHTAHAGWTVDPGATLRVAGDPFQTLVWSGGDVTGGGTTLVDGRLYVEAGGPKVLDGHAIEGGGMNVFDEFSLANGARLSAATLTLFDTNVLAGGGASSLVEVAPGSRIWERGSGGISRIEVPTVNRGEIWLDDAGLRFSQLLVQDHPDATLRLDSGTRLEVPNGIRVDAGRIIGLGTVAGDATVGGSIAPTGPLPYLSLGVLTFEGDLALTGTSTLDLELDVDGRQSGMTADRLSVSGDVELAGILKVSVFELQVPGRDDEFLLLEAGGELLGELSNAIPGAEVAVENLQGWDLRGRVYYGPTSPYDPNQIWLADFVFPEPSAHLLVALGLAAVSLHRRRRRLH